MATNPSRAQSSHVLAIVQALFVTFLWSTSWVLIKIGLNEIPALTFAGLRYTFAFLILLPIFFYNNRLSTLRYLPWKTWRQLLALGVVYYALTHGAQFVSIAYLPAVTANLVLGFTPVVVAVLSTFLLAERPLPIQWLGITISIAGLIIYFYPVQLPAREFIGLSAAIIGMLANAASALMGRAINRSGTLSPLFITTTSMGIGAIILLIVGVFTEGVPTITNSNWLIIGWLAVVNTAFAFTLWNQTLRMLSAVESSLINTTMAVQIPILAVIFLGESLTRREFVGLVITIIGVLAVQLARTDTSNRK